VRPPAQETVLGGLAEFERELILARTGAGRDRAKAEGDACGCGSTAGLQPRAALQPSVAPENRCRL
jgi:DNA invertase Pin-like site-specific DNA recombinase